MGKDRDPDAPRGPFSRWAAFVERRARWVLVACAAVVVAMAVYGAGAFEALALPKFDDPDSESVRAADRLENAAGYDVEPGFTVLVRGDGPVDGPGDQREIARLAR